MIERLSLDRSQSVFLIEAAGRILLVGAAERGLNVLAELDRTEAASAQGEITALTREPKVSERIRRMLGVAVQ